MHEEQKYRAEDERVIIQLLISFVFLKVGFVPHRRIYS
jgi:hypothetical protein